MASNRLSVKRFVLSAVILGGLFSCTGHHSREIIQAGVWRDTDGKIINAHGGGILFFNSVYYWYGEFKGDSTYRLNKIRTWECYRSETGGVSCYSSRNLADWKFEGIALSTVKEDTASDLHPSKIIERPKVIYNEKTHKFVMWMHIDNGTYTKAMAGVAVSDKPAGPFSYLGSFKPSGGDSRDQTIFRDDDGRAYQVASSEGNKTLYISLLSDDYTKTTGTYSRNFINNSREAPAVFKHLGKYYLITSACTGWDPNQAKYAVADSMLGPWKVIGNPCSGKDAGKTFYAQSTFVLWVQGEKDFYIAMFDRWNKTNLIDSRYIWLPVRFNDRLIDIPWTNRLNIN
ncbi:MAG: glycoside hydrolase family 43 protein [Bacteroidales bacterium]|jgi:sucrose-6-phosphate hydrolase SacC (GH32 family)